MKRTIVVGSCALLLFVGVGGELTAGTSVSDLPRLKWHVPIREYSSADSVLIRGAEWESIQKISVGMSLDDVASVCGAIPLEFHLHPGYALLQTRIDSKAYEVALKYNADRRIEAISYREMPSESPQSKEERQPNQALQTTPMTRSVYEKTTEFGYPQRGV